MVRTPNPAGLPRFWTVPRWQTTRLSVTKRFHNSPTRMQMPGTTKTLVKKMSVVTWPSLSTVESNPTRMVLPFRYLKGSIPESLPVHRYGDLTKAENKNQEKSLLSDVRNLSIFSVTLAVSTKLSWSGTHEFHISRPLSTRVKYVASHGTGTLCFQVRFSDSF